MKKTVVIGMSGGVDSSAAAYVLKEEGYNVIGVTMEFWQNSDYCHIEEEGGCGGLTAAEDARRVAEVLDIPYYVLDFRKEFHQNVIQYFINDYLQARTPNPCIMCNRYVKWEALLQRSRALGADYIATGHYARISKLENGRYAIMNSVTAEKDQTYALYGLTQEQLSHTLLPIGAYSKPEVRALAEKAGLPVAKKHDSQEICFIPDGDYASFIERNTDERMPEGNFVSKEGKILGKHRGLLHYTIGQRRGLNLPMGRRVFVTELRPESNEVVVGEHEDVFTNELTAGNITFMGIPEMKIGESGVFLTKIRYNHRGTECIVSRTGPDEIHCHFTSPVRAVTPGQAVVFYKDNYVAGGGVIKR